MRQPKLCATPPFSGSLWGTKPPKLLTATPYLEIELTLLYVRWYCEQRALHSADDAAFYLLAVVELATEVDRENDDDVSDSETMPWVDSLSLGSGRTVSTEKIT